MIFADVNNLHTKLSLLQFFIFVYKTYKTENNFSLDALDVKCLEYFYTSAMATSTLLHFLPLCKRQPNPVCLLNSSQETVIVEWSS